MRQVQGTVICAASTASIGKPTPFLPLEPPPSDWPACPAAPAPATGTPGTPRLSSTCTTSGTSKLRTPRQMVTAQMRADPSLAISHKAQHGACGTPFPLMCQDYADKTNFVFDSVHLTLCFDSLSQKHFEE